MLIRDIGSRLEKLALESNAYDLLVDAVEYIRWYNGDSITNMLFPILTDQGGYISVNEADLQHMDEFISENLKVIEKIDQSIQRNVCIVPFTEGLSRSEQAVQHTLNMLANFTRMHTICYLQARSLICHHHWEDALNAINRLFRFGAMLGRSWHDFLVDIDAEFAKINALDACIELALQKGIDHNMIRNTLSLINKYPPSIKEFLECRFGAFWNVVLSFFDRLGDHCDTSTVMNSLLNDSSFRHILTVLTIETENINNTRPLYPAMSLQDEVELKGYFTSLAAKWISERCQLSLDKRKTIEILENAFHTIWKQSTREPHDFQRFIEISLKRKHPTYRLSAVLKATASESVSQINHVIADIKEDQATMPIGQIAPNLIGKAMADDVIYAVHSKLLTGLIVWHKSLLLRTVTCTILAILEYQKSCGELPPDLNAVIARGYLKSLPHDPFTGNELIYDKHYNKIYLDQNVSDIWSYCPPKVDGKQELAWYFN
jgi:hypothetical protein